MKQNKQKKKYSDLLIVLTIFIISFILIFILQRAVSYRFGSGNTATFSPGKSVETAGSSFIFYLILTFLILITLYYLIIKKNILKYIRNLFFYLYLMRHLLILKIKNRISASEISFHSRIFTEKYFQIKNDIHRLEKNKQKATQLLRKILIKPGETNTDRIQKNFSQTSLIKARLFFLNEDYGESLKCYETLTLDNPSALINESAGHAAFVQNKGETAAVFYEKAYRTDEAERNTDEIILMRHEMNLFYTSILNNNKDMTKKYRDAALKKALKVYKGKPHKIKKIKKDLSID